MDVGGTHACALLAAGGIECWGYNANSKLGGAATVDGVAYATPQAVVGLPGPAIAVSTNFNNSCALVDSGVVFCWGAPAGVMSGL